jgi:hypothetical protein
MKMKDKKYIISSRVFPNISAAACPLVGQIATDSKILAYIIYKYLRRFSLKSLMKNDTYTIAVQLLKKQENGYYEAIKR